MARYHHALSRRDFMKALGLGAAGVGAAAAVIPVFKDLDDMMSQGEALDHTLKRAWYVKERPLDNPTTEVDWDMIKEHENNYVLNTFAGIGKSYAFSAEERAQMTQKANAARANGIAKNYGGFQPRDFMLNAGCGSGYLTNAWSQPKTTSVLWNTIPGLARYTGTPEENSKVIRAAAIFLGASSVGFGVLEGKKKKFCNKVHAEGYRPFVWDDVEWPYSDSDKIVVPNNRTLYAIGIGVAFSKELFRHGSSENGAGQLKTAGNGDRYRRWSLLYRSMQSVLNYMGYIACGYPEANHYGLLPSGGDGILVGLCEGGRSSNNFISPEHGMAQGYFSMVTDMPLAPTAPIDAGIFRFCHTCNKCAESCPSKAISFAKEPIWEGHLDPNSYQYAKDKEVKCVGAGKKNFIWDAYACNYYASTVHGGCCNCMGTCTFNTNNGAGIHGMVKGLLATTSLFNGFLWRADKAYGFGLTPDDKKAEWWDMSLPVSGIDSTICASDSAYRKRAY